MLQSNEEKIPTVLMRTSMPFAWKNPTYRIPVQVPPSGSTFSNNSLLWSDCCSQVTVLPRKTPSETAQLHQWFHCRNQAKGAWFPAGTRCLVARGLSPQHVWEQAPRMITAKPCFSGLQSINELPRSLCGALSVALLHTET